MTTTPPFINIKAKANHNAVFLMLLALVLFFITLIFSQYYWRTYRLVLVFIYLLIIVIMFTGLLKRSEPRVSFELTPEHIQYTHRYGNWMLNWQQIQNINTIKEVVGLKSISLPYVGIRLENLDSLAEQISPRLANRLIHEQRPLLSFTVMQNLLSLEEIQLNFNPYVLASGKIIKGPLAAFLHHCQILHKGLGYHLYIPEPSTDRDIDDFCHLLRQCQRYCVDHC
jgi:energy-coupling factor transporter transmembrane protein EcfT